jgi:hypothetical protein
MIEQNRIGQYRVVRTENNRTGKTRQTGHNKTEFDRAKWDNGGRQGICEKESKRQSRMCMNKMGLDKNGGNRTK